ncbi:AEC family transporter [Microvirga flavescens]|uniref:AEC family transporter n=1 Tax=Microvirga flavescens TaxID=2249811 RepID=UPI000DD9457B|nr:AEC family transporter [Microvirga flavescens]
MAAIIASLVPVFLLIATGWASRASGFVNDQCWSGIERITYVMFFPALIVKTLSQADLSTVPMTGVGGALMIAILLMSALVLLSRPLLQRAFAIDGPSFTSVFQGATRWNSFTGLAVAESLFGQRGVTLMAVAIAAMVPLLNVLAIFVFVRFAGGPKQRWSQILRTFATNPFIWSCGIGLAMNAFGIVLPRPLSVFLDALASAALAAGLLVVGAGLDIRRLAKPRAPHAIASALKLVAMPCIAVALARSFDVTGADITVTAIAASVPSASAAYVLARQLGGNAALMAEILTLQTLFAMASMPIMMTVLS